MTRWFPALALLAAANLQAADVTVSIEPLFALSGSAFSGLPTAHASVTSESSAGTSGVTHIVTGPLTPLPGDANAIGGTFQGVDSSTGDVLVSGGIGFELSSPPATDAGTSPIVGVIPVPDGWDSVTATPVSANLANATGTSTYDSGTLTLSLGNPTVTGTISYTVNSQTSVELAPFSLSSGGNTYNFSGVTLDLEDGGAYKGFILATDATDFNNAAYVLTVTDSNDSDNDGIPNLTDSDNAWYAPFTAGTNGFIHSDWYGGFWNLSQQDWIYHGNWGYQFIQPFVPGWVLAWDWSIWAEFGGGTGWLAVSKDFYPYIYAYDLSGGTWIYYETGSGNGGSGVNIYIYSGPLSTNGWQGTGWHHLTGGQ